MINEKQAGALATLLHQMRRGWSIPSMMKLFEKNADHPAPFADIAVAAAAAANDDKVTSPGIIFIDTRFWPEPAKPKLPPPVPCEDHGTEPANNCRSCLADVKAGQRKPENVGKINDPSTKPTPPPEGWRPRKVEPKPIPPARPLSKVEPATLDSERVIQG